MIKYYWKQAWELLKQHKLFSVLYITGAGLAIAMTIGCFCGTLYKSGTCLSGDKPC